MKLLKQWLCLYCDEKREISHAQARDLCNDVMYFAIYQNNEILCEADCQLEHWSRHTLDASNPL